MSAVLDNDVGSGCQVKINVLEQNVWPFGSWKWRRDKTMVKVL
jgi:hypothetical protein